VRRGNGLSACRGRTAEPMETVRQARESSLLRREKHGGDTMSPTDTGGTEEDERWSPGPTRQWSEPRARCGKCGPSRQRLKCLQCSRPRWASMRAHTIGPAGKRVGPAEEKMYWAANLVLAQNDSVGFLLLLFFILF
jgi:hypothetical protein